MFILGLCCTSCGPATSAGASAGLAAALGGILKGGVSREPTTGGPDVFIQVTRIVETTFWDADKLNPQAFLKGAVGGIEPDLRRQGGNVSQQGSQMVVVLNGQTKAIDLSSIKTTADLRSAFADLHSMLLQYQRGEGKAVNWEYDAIEGILKGLDSNSEFMPPHAFREMLEEAKGDYAGIGIRIDLENGEIVFREAMKGSPASRAGLNPGDRIVTIDGYPTKGLTLQEAIRRMRGPVGSQMVLGILRPGSAEPEEIAVTRAKLRIETVESRMLDGHIGYVKVTSFHDTTRQDAASVLSRLVQHNKAEALILDLRNNPGGLLSESVEVCKLFVDNGSLITYTEGRVRNQNARYVANGAGLYRHYPLIVLINSRSAAGSEIVAGALQDLQKARIVGSKSYGQGSIQTIFPLRDGSGLRLTTAHFFTPTGRNIDGVGITPDIDVQNDGKEDRQLIVAYAILKEALSPGNRPNSPLTREDASIGTGIREVGREMFAATSVGP